MNRRFVAGLVVVSVALAGCGTDRLPGPSDLPEPPCEPRAGTMLEFSQPGQIGRAPAGFAISGGEIWVTARGFLHGGIFDPDVGRTAVYIGPESDPPRPIEGSVGLEDPHLLEFVIEDHWRSFTLDPGNYWLVSARADIQVLSCEPDVVLEEVPLNWRSPSS